MPQYRKKPVVIVATQWHKGDPALPGMVSNTVNDGWAIQTLEGTMVVGDGDWVITGVEGERYPCKDSIFQKTYEAVPS